jgi:hypothetical protein
VHIRTGDEWEKHSEEMMARSKLEKLVHKRLERPAALMTLEANLDGFNKCVKVGLRRFSKESIFVFTDFCQIARYEHRFGLPGERVRLAH